VAFVRFVEQLVDSDRPLDLQAAWSAEVGSGVVGARHF
jgi:hypothetical protein